MDIGSMLCLDTGYSGDSVNGGSSLLEARRISQMEEIVEMVVLSLTLSSGEVTFLSKITLYDRNINSNI